MSWESEVDSSRRRYYVQETKNDGSQIVKPTSEVVNALRRGNG